MLWERGRESDAVELLVVEASRQGEVAPAEVLRVGDVAVAEDRRERLVQRGRVDDRRPVGQGVEVGDGAVEAVAV